MKKRILAYGRLSEAQMAQLSREFEVQQFKGLASADDPEFRAALPGAHGLIGSSVAISAELLENAPNLEAIASISVGYDNYDMEALSQRGILLCNTPDVLTETTADTGFTLIMATARRVVELADFVKRGDWQKSIGPEHFGSDVHGKTLGMVGFGRIGAAVARRGALGFGMRVRYAMASPKPALEAELGAERRELDELLAESDFVCVTVPLSEATRHLIGAHELTRMKSSAILVNIARGPVVDEAALIEALEMGHIRAAGLDVFEREPLSPESPLPHMANVVALPHIGSATHETRDAMAQRAVDNLILALTGERPISLVNEDAWENRHNA
ncbi:2-hydroxyacid dehydrogenase [Halomonas urumqiensis]|uniref:Bifunctional glyoxylate/hydroxypyruvate reductase B n=1 Tax=Halomonas urumqiensis TaxID=1684789 RepID=A0A2N7UKL0_9GAMM|nr:D-glycerate dehydrogenase [Halomonas urumqiensis]PMR80939.1 bifunctional glyoxylate/hydroxypyruvate reductase B [Halomonas urumqiensis]PTB02896.1 D-glycerate dehydrogenase [Halomonas urumqiensis]GHE21421.1 bifunctional glyoxylate/hydroxypyruvate reductase B [Halomonas urumqiensis]